MKVAEVGAKTEILGVREMAFMTPQERAESLRETIHMDIDLVEGDGAGHSWRLTDKGFARIAAIIRDAENDALERAAEVCEAVHLGTRTRYNILLDTSRSGLSGDEKPVVAGACGCNSSVEA